MSKELQAVLLTFQTRCYGIKVSRPEHEASPCCLRWSLLNGILYNTTSVCVPVTVSFPNFASGTAGTLTVLTSNGWSRRSKRAWWGLMSWTPPSLTSLRVGRALASRCLNGSLRSWRLRAGGGGSGGGSGGGTTTPTSTTTSATPTTSTSNLTGCTAAHWGQVRWYQMDGMRLMCLRDDLLVPESLSLSVSVVRERKSQTRASIEYQYNYSGRLSRLESVAWILYRSEPHYGFECRKSAWF
jgi:hypothetical protein